MSSLELNLNFEDETKHISSDYSEQSDSALSSAQKRFDIAVEDGEETYTKAQWKSMSPKERRQLRNKISARNFRTRRKEYMTTIEIDLEKSKQVATKLQQQVDVYKTQNEELRTENSQLRLQVLLLTQRGSVTPPQQPYPHQQQYQQPMQQQQQQQQHWSMNDILAVSNIQPQNFNRSTPPTSPPSTASEYDSTVPASSSSPYQMELLSDMTTPVNYNNNMYPMDQIYTFLSHAVVPNWNVEQLMNQTLSSQSTRYLLREYSLLAPALMSIIVRDTFVKNYQDFMKTSPKLLTAAPSTSLIHRRSAQQPKLSFSARKGIENLSHKELKLIWDLLQSGLQRKDETDGHDLPVAQISSQDQAEKFIVCAKTWVWMKANVCNVVNNYISMYANARKQSS
ncbi:hypothetical protein INT43_004190 [Umbelopsis isabellina]|uniref:BZIP domain-containing protein n=1 Tax=Mortierella isabellina TaxID=91625 RepID=A0A8H7U930_MORIS|nr:hypothetical protein INT43_004190 [Umbelopsis isabellina]